MNPRKNETRRIQPIKITEPNKEQYNIFLCKIHIIIFVFQCISSIYLIEIAKFNGELLETESNPTP